MIVIGVTGSIGMGKTTLANQFAELGANICNSDAVVHKLMEIGGEAVPLIAVNFPAAIKDGAVDRKKLGEIVFSDKEKRRLLEGIIHPLVVAEEKLFLERERAKGSKIAVLDIPLLFETGAEARCDYTITATAPHFIQKCRVMKRPGMTKEKFRQILKSQMPDREKRKRADFVVQTGFGKAYSLWQIMKIMRKINA